MRRKRDNPEKRIEDKIREKLTLRGWYVIKMHGNMFQAGVPDLYATHAKYGSRWIEVKTPKGSFTPAQMDTFPKLAAHGTKIWVLTSSEDSQLDLLFKHHNWFMFLRL